MSDNNDNSNHINEIKKKFVEIFSFPKLISSENNKTSVITLFQKGAELNIIQKRIKENQKIYSDNFLKEKYTENNLINEEKRKKIHKIYV